MLLSEEPELNSISLSVGQQSFKKINYQMLQICRSMILTVKALLKLLTQISTSMSPALLKKEDWEYDASIWCNFLIFNWRIISLQCCVGSCLMTTWISHNYYIYPLPLKPPSHLSPHPAPLGHHKVSSWGPCPFGKVLQEWRKLPGKNGSVYEHRWKWMSSTGTEGFSDYTCEE